MNSLAKKRRIFIITALAIPVLLLVCFVVVPAVDLIRMSFTNWDGLYILQFRTCVGNGGRDNGDNYTDICCAEQDNP